MGLLAAILAATLQFVFLAGSLSGAFSGASAATASGHCGEPAGGHSHDDAACALCPVCLSATVPGLLPPSPPKLAVPADYAVLRGAAPSTAQLQPSAILAAAYPRGPPSI